MRNRGGCEYLWVGSVNFAQTGLSAERVGLMRFNGIPVSQV